MLVSECGKKKRKKGGRSLPAVVNTTDCVSTVDVCKTILVVSMGVGSDCCKSMVNTTVSASNFERDISSLIA